MLPLDRSTNRLIGRIRTQADQLKGLCDQQLAVFADQLRQRIGAGEDVRSIDIVCQSFALTTEALRRQTGMTYYDVQLASGLVLAAGAIAEIQTGEGKTITTALPAVLHGLTGRGVHVATTNDYLSKRDHDELEPIYKALGLTSGLLTSRSQPAENRHAYAADITYGPGYEFGFDFLKDQLTIRGRHQEPLGQRFLRTMQGVTVRETPLAQRGHAFAIIDEADSVLIDEATTPLILSGGRSSAATSQSMYEYARRVATELRDKHFECDLGKRTVKLNNSGWESVHEAFNNRPAGRLARPWSQLIEHALRAEHILERDVDYVVTDDRVMIVDQNTGRIHDERTWSASLHQAVEVKENVTVTAEQESQARITRQRYCGFYASMCGLTGTATGSEDELRVFYRLPVVQIPTNEPCVRKSLPLRMFASRKAKFQAICQDIATRSDSHQPVLVGTRTIADSKRLSELLTDCGIKHVVLNGLQDEQEAAVVARAGVAGAVTVATNMAGRGTDIRLDRRAKRAGGLHVIGTELHHSQRVDRQLAGRAARQGDPGSCQFFASAEDELIVARDPKLAQQIRNASQGKGECGGGSDFLPAIKRIQSTLEREAAKQRVSMVEHDKWLESVQSSLARRA